ncbi:ribose-5-phosphate isomerase [Naumannella cuiyingiana]|uniref:Ribose-5-phosphate isomerase B n=1 Tax=Naumannella cuiyingiana TaxID=1347891 RepID=A0A7Z0IJZ9_9ACTN|nr:ribose-5-phosphate isomerase [Naumannella cuiyingiana]NYI70085.1 ribose 5-phosphate isomerase B [Naumannella cuiyingiana]
MRVHLAADHAGFELKAALADALAADGHEVVDHGAAAYDADDDYPAYCIAAAEAVRDDPGSLGIVIGGSGNGEQIAANKVEGIRAALIHSTETARLAREHNDAQVAGIGARMHTPDAAIELARIFVGTPFSNNPRHVRRIEQVAAYDAARG